MKPTMYLSHHQRCYVDYIRANPGCSMADVCRACKVNPRAGHKWIYDGLTRLIRRGIVYTQPSLTDRRRRRLFTAV